MGAAHAILSPSGASRWMVCTPSARLEQEFPDRSGEAAREGTHAHALGELLLRRRAGLISGAVFKRELKKLEKSEYYNHAMLEHTDNYATLVMERYQEAHERSADPRLYLEQRFDLTEWIPEGFGTGDAVIIADGLLDIVDLKYGQGVPVSAVDNPQMKIYALGALHAHGLLYDIHTVRMTIFQPRLDSCSVWEIPAEELLAWGEDELKPRAELAFAGGGEYLPGKHCVFCRAKALCKANAEYNQEIASHEFRSVDMLTDEDVSDILKRAGLFKSWLKGVEDYALDQAVNHDKKWPGFKLVEGRSVRQYADESKVAEAFATEGFSDEELFNVKLKGITELTKLVGKKLFEEKTKGLLIKPPGALALVPESDKRPAYVSADGAVADFADIEAD